MELRLMTLAVWICAFAIGATLFWTSKQVQNAEAVARKQERSIAYERERYAVLEAEWHYLNNPDRLEKLAANNFVSSDVDATEDTAPVILTDTLSLPEFQLPVVPMEKPVPPVMMAKKEPVTVEEEAPVIVAAAEKAPVVVEKAAQPVAEKPVNMAAVKVAPVQAQPVVVHPSYNDETRGRFQAMLASYTTGGAQ